MSVIHEALERRPNFVRKFSLAASLAQNVATHAMEGFKQWTPSPKIYKKRFSRETPRFIDRHAAVIFLGIMVLFVLFARLFVPQQMKTQVLFPSQQANETTVLPSQAETPVSSNTVRLHSFSDFVLTGIIDGEQPIALINGNLKGVGDAVGANAVVKDIQGKRVVLDYHGRQVTLAL